MSDEFLTPTHGAYQMDKFHSRSSILGAIRSALPELHGVLLDLGCGQMPYRTLVTTPPGRVQHYVGLDLSCATYGGRHDVSWDGQTIPLRDSSVDCVLATEVLEHCHDPQAVLREIYRVLRPSGVLLLTVPFLWPMHDAPADEYRYTPFCMERHLTAAGFTGMAIRIFGGWDASMAQMLGLWVRRRPMQEHFRRVLQRLILPVQRWLLAGDVPPHAATNEMITGFSAMARKPKPDIREGREGSRLQLAR